MKSTDKESGMPKPMLGAARPSHIISKINAASISSTRVIPIIRTLLIPPPQIFKTDPANFLALVQKLTGKQPAAKKLTEQKKKKKSMIRAKSVANRSQQSFPNQASEKEYPQSAALERDSLEERGVQACDIFSKLLGELENVDFLSTLRDSWPTLPEFPMSYPPVAEQIDYHTAIFETLDSGGFSHFY